MRIGNTKVHPSHTFHNYKSRWHVVVDYKLILRSFKPPPCLALGMDLTEVTVDLDDLEKYCQEQGLKNTSGTRSQHVADVLSDQLQKWPPLKLRFKKKKRRTR